MQRLYRLIVVFFVSFPTLPIKAGLLDSCLESCAECLVASCPESSCAKCCLATMRCCCGQACRDWCRFNVRNPCRSCCKALCTCNSNSAQNHQIAVATPPCPVEAMTRN